MSSLAPLTCFPFDDPDASTRVSLHEGGNCSAIQPHWRSFPPPPYPFHASIGLLMFVMFVAALIGNSLVLIVYNRFRYCRNPEKVLIMNLAVCDLGMAITNFPLYVIASFSGEWVFSDEVCEMYGFVGSAFGLASINTMAAISLDRYHVIVRTQLNREIPTVTRMGVCVAGVWLYALLWSCPPLFGWNQYTYEGYGTHCSFDYLSTDVPSRAFVVAIFCGGFLLPLLLIVVCYTYIFLCVWSQGRHLHHAATETRTDDTETQGRRSRSTKSGRSKREYKAEIQTAKTILLVVGIYCLSWTPYAVVSLIGVFGDQRLLTPVAATIPGLLAKASTLYNPLVYALCVPRFKSRLRSLMLRVCCGVGGGQVVIARRGRSGSGGSTLVLSRRAAVRARSRDDYLATCSNASLTSDTSMSVQSGRYELENISASSSGLRRQESIADLTLIGDQLL